MTFGGHVVVPSAGAADDGGAGNAIVLEARVLEVGIVAGSGQLRH